MLISYLFDINSRALPKTIFVIKLSLKFFSPIKNYDGSFNGFGNVD